MQASDPSDLPVTSWLQQSLARPGVRDVHSCFSEADLSFQVHAFPVARLRFACCNVFPEARLQADRTVEY
jgi:hypothetical protein